MVILQHTFVQSPVTTMINVALSKIFNSNNVDLYCNPEQLKLLFQTKNTLYKAYRLFAMTNCYFNVFQETSRSRYS